MGSSCVLSAFTFFIMVLFLHAFQQTSKIRMRRASMIHNTLSNEDRLKNYWKEKEKLVYSETGYKLKLDTFEKESEQLHDRSENVKVEGPIESTAKESTFGVGKRQNEVTENVMSLGNWIEAYGNFILRPSADDFNPPVGVIHFLGGAFVGAAPHVAYRYLLESLCDAGFVVVATPYRLDFDYARTCDYILEKFDSIAIDLANDYGPLPVVGIGHSCGALLQTLITCLFPSAPRAANVLISFNNKPVKEAIPAFEELVVPLSSVFSSNYDAEIAKTMKETVNDLISTSPLLPSVGGNDLVPIIRESIEVVDQIPDILKMIGEGISEFTPSPGDTKEVCRRMYRARSTLLLKFDNDSLDESEDIEQILKEANTIMRMKRPMVEMDVELRYLDGTHITPLTQNIFVDAVDLNIPVPTEGTTNPLKDQLLKDVDVTKTEILKWLDVKLGRSSGGKNGYRSR